MKILIATLLFITSLSFSSWGQDKNATKYNQKLVSFYGIEYLDQLSKFNVGAYEHFNYLVSKGYSIENSEKDLSMYPDLNSVKRILSKTNSNFNIQEFQTEALFNIVSYDIQPQEKKQYFRIGETGKLLVVYSRKEITNAINK